MALCCFFGAFGCLSRRTGGQNCLALRESPIWSTYFLLSRGAAPETLIKRRETRYDYLPSLLGDEDKLSEIRCSEEKNILYWAESSSQGRTKISYTGTTTPTNQSRKDPFHMYSLSPHFASVSTVSSGAPPLSGISGRCTAIPAGCGRRMRGVVNQFPKPT